MIVRHEDGSVCFWDVSSTGIRLLYKLTTVDMFGGYYRSDMSDIDADEEWPPFRKVHSPVVFLSECCCLYFILHGLGMMSLVAVFRVYNYISISI